MYMRLITVHTFVVIPVVSSIPEMAPPPSRSQIALSELVSLQSSTLSVSIWNFEISQWKV